MCTHAGHAKRSSKISCSSKALGKLREPTPTWEKRLRPACRCAAVSCWRSREEESEAKPLPQGAAAVRTSSNLVWAAHA